MKKEHLPALIIFSGFCLFLSLPLIGLINNILFQKELFREKFIRQENRPPANFPAFPKDFIRSKLPEKLEKFFTDHYAFRNTLIRGHSLIAWHLLKKSINPEDCQIGRDNFLFLSDNHAKVFSQHSGALPVSETDLMNAEKHQTQLKDWCRSKNIIYLCVVPPDKHSIYPEYLPQWVMAPQKKIFIDKLVSRIKDKDLVLNLKPALLEAKQLHKDTLYPKCDTHWNALGAYAGYKELMKKLSSLAGKTLRIVESPKFDRREIWAETDLSLMSKTNGFIKDIYITPLIDIDPDMIEVRTFSGDPVKPYPALIPQNENFIVENKNALNKGSLVIVRDSFSTMLSPFLYASFEKTVFIGTAIIPPDLGEWLEANHPDYLINEQIERGTPYTLPVALGEILKTSLPINRRAEQLRTHSDRAYTVSLDNPALLPATYCTLSLQNKTLLVQSRKNDFCFEFLPDQKTTPPAKSLLVEIEMTAPETTSSQLFYQTEESPEYSEEKSEHLDVKKGKQTLIFSLKSCSPIKKLRFDPGELPGDYLIHSLRICPFDENQL